MNYSSPPLLMKFMDYLAIFVWLVELAEFIVEARPHIILSNAGFNRLFLIVCQNINKISYLTYNVSFIQAIDVFPISTSLLLISGKIQYIYR